MSLPARQPLVARTIWHALEPIHAPTYFADRCIDAYKDAGLKGFWMGYFAGRAAPLGEVGPGPVEALFFNFHPAMVRRALPDAWQYASPSTVLDVRATAAAQVVRELTVAADAAATELVPLLQRAVDGADDSGRPLFAANRDVATRADPVEQLWQATTSLREHRGDGHVAILTAEGLSGLEAHVLQAEVHGVDPEVYLRSRGWTDDDWRDAAERLRTRGDARELHGRIETRTDQLAAAPYAVLSDDEVDTLLQVAGRLADEITASGLYPFPNPIGLPPR